MDKSVFFQLRLPKCVSGDVLTLVSRDKNSSLAYSLPPDFFLHFAHASVGMHFCTDTGVELLTLQERVFIPDSFVKGQKMNEALIVTARQNIEAGIYAVTLQLAALSLAVVTLSDKASQGLRVDTSGAQIIELVQKQLNVSVVRHYIIPDDLASLRGLVAQLAYQQKYSLIVTTGGTGLTKRDITPEALSPLLERPLHGFTHAMMAASLAKTPHAILSRSVAGIIDKSLLFTLPGSTKAVEENLMAVLPALEHALQKIQDDPSDCGR